MVRERIAKLCFGLAVILTPLSYAVKSMSGAADITWVDPTLILSFLVFALMATELRDKPGWFLIVFALLSAILGSLLHKGQPDRLEASWYVIFRDPIELTLCFLWFWICIMYFRRERTFAVRCVALSAILQFAVGVYFYFAMVQLVPVPGPVLDYLRAYAVRQTLVFGLASIPRMAGTFDEAPLFGLFMLSCFVILALELIREGHCRNKLIMAGMIASAIGTVASVSDQTLLGLALFLIAAAFRAAKLGNWLARVALIAALVSTGYVVGHSLIKSQIESETRVSVYGQSLGERAFHARYAMTILAHQEPAILFGVGPGRYGDYISETGMFPSTVTPAVVAIEWLIGYGLIGFLAICIWLYDICMKARISLGVLGLGAFAGLVVGNMFQSRWLWEGWFLALAYLYAAHIPLVGKREETTPVLTESVSEPC